MNTISALLLAGGSQRMNPVATTRLLSEVVMSTTNLGLGLFEGVVAHLRTIYLLIGAKLPILFQLPFRD